jgi:hypothetical protein
MYWGNLHDEDCFYGTFMQYQQLCINYRVKYEDKSISHGESCQVNWRAIDMTILAKRVNPHIATTPWGEALIKANQTVSLYTTVSSNPIHLPRVEQVILGRIAKNGSDQADIDLSQHGAEEYGVSRIHAAVSINQNQVRITDLGSRNGTYLNSRKLSPNVPTILCNGDEIRLGNLVLFVYFARQPEQPTAPLNLQSVL